VALFGYHARAKNLPDGRSSLAEDLNYTFVFETTGDRNFDYWVSLENRENGTWSATFTNSSTGMSKSGDVFPGTLQGDQSVNGSVEFDSFGAPSMLRRCVITQRVTPAGEVTAQDDMPGKDCFGNHRDERGPQLSPKSLPGLPRSAARPGRARGRPPRT
jgi:hypothetical protein